MSNGPWYRLYCDLPNCGKLRRLPAETQLAYVWLLCLHKRGHLLTATPEEIGWELRTDPGTVTRWLADLTAAGLLAADRTPVGWAERQFESDTSTPRVQAFRKRHGKQAGNKGMKRSRNVSETADETDHSIAEHSIDRTEKTPRTPTSGGDALASQCEKLYQAYPRHEAKAAALKAIAKALCSVHFPELFDAVTAYAEAVRGQDVKFIPHPASWFNAGRWQDDRSGWAAWKTGNQPGLAIGQVHHEDTPLLIEEGKL